MIKACPVCGSGDGELELIGRMVRHDACGASFPMESLPLARASDEPDNSHYTKGGIEPWAYIQANSLNFFEGSVVKYVTRWRYKNGIEDLRKARVYIDELIRQEEDREKRS